MVMLGIAGICILLIEMIEMITCTAGAGEK